MRKYLCIGLLFITVQMVFLNTVRAGENLYVVGVNDILSISILQPDKFDRIISVSPDGTIVFPYIGTVRVKGLTLDEIKEKVQLKLANGYMKYPVVLVTLEESKSRNYLVYGEVTRPGEYTLSENSTVLSAISLAGGFTRFGSSSRVKVLRQRDDKPGYETIKVNIKEVMNGDSNADVLLKIGDMIVVSEGVF